MTKRVEAFQEAETPKSIWLQSHSWLRCLRLSAAIHQSLTGLFASRSLPPPLPSPPICLRTPAPPSALYGSPSHCCTSPCHPLISAFYHPSHLLVLLLASGSSPLTVIRGEQAAHHVIYGALAVTSSQNLFETTNEVARGSREAELRSEYSSVCLKGPSTVWAPLGNVTASLAGRAIQFKRRPKNTSIDLKIMIWLVSPQ